MSTNKKYLACVLILSAIFFAGCCCCWKRPGQPGRDCDPRILLQPVSQVVAKSNTLMLTVHATNPPPYQLDAVLYQWHFNGVAIPGAIASSLIISNFQLANVGQYRVIVTGPCGSTPSEPADGVLKEDNVEDPTGNSGTLTIGTSSFGAGTSSGCFPSSSGWDKRHTLPGYFYKVFSPVPDPYLNTGNLPKVTVSTCDSLNGTTLETGIVIHAEFDINDKVCAPPNSALCNVGSPTKLSIATRSMVNIKRYRAVIYYKSGTATGLSNITVKWEYTTP